MAACSAWSPPELFSHHARIPHPRLRQPLAPPAPRQCRPFLRDRAVGRRRGRGDAQPLGEQAAPQDIATTLAEMKAVRVSSRHPAALVIGADSTLACNGRLFDKPPTLAAARKQLLALARPDARALLLGGGGARRRAALALERAGASHHAAVHRGLPRRLSRARRRGRAAPRSAPTSSRGWARISSARSRATTSPSSACRCCRCCPSWRSHGIGLEQAA